MTKQEATEYLTKVQTKWSKFNEWHRKFTEALDVLLLENKHIEEREETEEYKIIITGEKRTSVLERFITFREYLLLEGIIDALERAGAPECIKLEHVE